MALHSWFGKYLTRPITRSFRKIPPRFRPALQALEGRWVPSTFIVNSITTTGTGSGLSGDLRYCINLANSTAGVNTIDFGSTVFNTPQTITLTGSQFELSNKTGTETIAGPTAGVTISGGGKSRVFQIDTNVTASISGLTISGGNISQGYGGGISILGSATLANCIVSGNSATMGGGVYNHGMTTLTNCTVRGNTSSDDNGGGIYNRGTATLTNCTVSGNIGDGLYNSANSMATLNNCTVSGNSVMFGGGGISNSGIAILSNCTVSGNSISKFGGGGIYNYASGNTTLSNCTVSGNSSTGICGGIASFGTVTLTNCTISGNSARGGFGGLFNGGSAALINCAISGNGGAGLRNTVYGMATLTNCTISGNSTSGYGGGLSNKGTATLTNCTISGNSAGINGGGLYSGYNATATLTNCTISGNSAGKNGGGLYNYVKNGTTTLSNTIVAGNTSKNGPDAYGAFISAGTNLIGKTNASSGWTGSDLTGTIANPLNPLLAPLGNYGGPTQTIALLPGSPALNSGNPSSPGLQATDQRGFPQVVNGMVDIGAIEHQLNVALTSSINPSSTPLNPTFTATVIGAFPNPTPTGTVTFQDTIQGVTTTLGTVALGPTGLAAFTPTFTLAQGTHTITTNYSGDSNNPAGSATLMQTVNDAPAVLSVTENGGNALNNGQISIVNELEVTFDKAVALQPGAFTLTRVGLPNGQPGDGATITPNISITTNANGQTVAILTFAGTNTDNGSLQDGNWTLTVTAASVASAASGQTMLADFTQTNVRRLFGLVVPGGTIVDSTDYSQFANSYGQSPGQPGYNSAFDFTNTGSQGNPIDATDFMEFSLRFGESI